MLVESTKIRESLNSMRASPDTQQGKHLVDEQSNVPNTYRCPMNPFPGIIILLLGITMSSHHQSSMVSTMLHKQWGTLLASAALARGVTYILMYLSPPRSTLPSRPPSELVTAFCLISGGLVFMASAHDVVEAIEANDLDAMFLFTVMMGLTAFLMAWTIVVLAIKAWAVRREQRSMVPTSGLA